ncbi:MAG: ABC transporter permease [Roseburia sp.]
MNNLYSKLAGSNIKNSRQFYIPYLLTGILNVAMFYMMVSLCNNSGIEKIPGSTNLKTILTMGVYVIGIFSFIFLFYTNSFIIKRRKREIGIYNILGMEKRHISKVLFMETLFVTAISVFGGLVFGIVFSKLLTMILYRLMNMSESIAFYISIDGIRMSCILFGIIFLAAYCYNLLQIKLANPIELLSGSSVGEKEPKTKLLLAITGVVCIGVGYYISITTKSPLKAIMLFFVAVVLVIIGTYCLFTAGSIALLKVLRKNKNFYYKSKHFTAVSGMMYRMKQNAVGLANICILSTMVLVMVSATVSLYFGVEDELKTRYPAEITATANYTNEIEDPSVFTEQVTEQVKSCGRTITGVKDACSFTVMAVEENGEYLFGETNMFQENTCMFGVMSREDFLEMNEDVKENELKEIPEGEVAIVGYPLYEKDTITIGGQTYQVAKSMEYSSDDDEIYADMVAGIYYMLVEDEALLNELFEGQREAYQNNFSMLTHQLYIDIDGTPEEKIACANAVEETFATREGDGWESFYVEGRQRASDDFYTLYGGLFFLGLFLGIMFLMVTVLIIFYKQISEGYDDKKRFEIMEKVGMNNQEVKATIQSQVRIVFFLPLLTAAIHLWAAFPLLRRILAMLNLTNVGLFAKCVGVTIVLFGVIYYVVFKMTSKAYYKIVGNQVS